MGNLRVVSSLMLKDDVTRKLVLTLEGFNDNFRLHIDPEMIFRCCESTENESSTMLIINELFSFKQKKCQTFCCACRERQRRGSVTTLPVY